MRATPECRTIKRNHWIDRNPQSCKEPVAMPFISQLEIDSRDDKQLFPGVATRTWWGEQILISRVTLEPGAEAPLHSHSNEQAGVVLNGALVMKVGDEERTLLPGELYLAPGDVPHRAVAGPEGCVVIEFFSPLREPLMY